MGSYVLWLDLDMGLTDIYLIRLLSPSLVVLKIYGNPAEQRKPAQGVEVKIP